jgi:hypothetical protein
MVKKIEAVETARYMGRFCLLVLARHPDAVRRYGPMVSVHIGVCQERREQLLAAGQAVPDAIKTHLVLDTGADQTCVISDEVQTLGIDTTHAAELHTPSTAGTPQEAHELDVSLEVCDLTWTVIHRVDSMRVYEFKRFHEMVGGLLGRDVLESARFNYNGPAGTFELIFDPSNNPF